MASVSVGVTRTRGQRLQIRPATPAARASAARSPLRRASRPNRPNLRSRVRQPVARREPVASAVESGRRTAGFRQLLPFPCKFRRQEFFSRIRSGADSDRCPSAACLIWSGAESARSRLAFESFVARPCSHRQVPVPAPLGSPACNCKFAICSGLHRAGPRNDPVPLEKRCAKFKSATSARNGLP